MFVQVSYQMLKSLIPFRYRFFGQKRRIPLHHVSIGLPQVSMARSAEALHRSVKGEGDSSPTAAKDRSQPEMTFQEVELKQTFHCKVMVKRWALQCLLFSKSGALHWKPFWDFFELEIFVVAGCPNCIQRYVMYANMSFVSGMKIWRSRWRQDLRLAEVAQEELLRHRRHTAFYKASRGIGQTSKPLGIDHFNGKQ